MVDTLIDVVNEVLVDTQQRQKTAFSNNDDTNFIVARVNDGVKDIYHLTPDRIDTNGTVTITPSTRLFDGPVNLDVTEIHDWSFRIDNSDGDIKVAHVPKEYIVTTYPQYETHEADKPLYVYQEGTQLGIYPLLEAGASNLTLQFIYPAVYTKLVNTTDTFPFIEGTLEKQYVKAYAQMRYEVFKGLGQPALTIQMVDDLWAALVGKYNKTKRIGFVGYRRYA